MVKVPIRTKVIVDLWDSKKGQGMVKRYSDTMDLINAESEFDLKKGDRALVIKSYNMFVKVIPEDEYSKILIGSDLNKVNIKGLAQVIGFLLKKKESDNGGILQIDNVFNILNKTSLKYILKKKHILKASNVKNSIFDTIKINNILYLALNPSENTNDIQIIINYSKYHTFLTERMIQTEFTWTNLRIKRILEYLITIGRCRKDVSYRSGTRYYFVK